MPRRDATSAVPTRFNRQLRMASWMLAVALWTLPSQAQLPGSTGTANNMIVPAELPHMPLDHMPEMPKATAIPVPNGSFEKGLEGWNVSTGAPEAFSITEAAASMGAKGLCVKANDSQAKLVSASFPAEAGRIYGAQFWGRAKSGNVCVQMVFFGADEKALNPIRIYGNSTALSLQAKGHFENYNLRAVAPEGTTHLKLIVNADRNSAGDIDDAHLWEFPAVNTPFPVDVESLKAEVTANPYRGKPATKIVLKLDDLTRRHPSWLKVVDFLNSKGGIKANFGIICNSLENGSPQYYDWIKELNASERIEFWCHGYDHSENPVNGTKIQEFRMPYEYQKRHLEDSQRLAKEKLGFPFKAFGAPYNAVNADTAGILSDMPDLKVWMYGDADNSAGKLVLGRFGCVNLENPTLIPDFQKFLDGYVHNRGYPYYCLQGHPGQWGAERWDNFTEIVSFLVEQKAVFVRASELTEKDIAVPAE